MTIACEPSLNKTDNLKFVNRNDFLCIACVIALVAGLLFPLSTHILDVFLIFSLSLTAAVLIIALLAQSLSQVMSLPLLILLAVMLRVSLSVAASKLIFSRGNAGTIISFLAGALFKNNCTFITLFIAILAPTAFVIIYKAVKCINRATAGFITGTIPCRKNNIEIDLNTGSINSTQATNMLEKIACDVSFFIAMTGLAKFMLCTAAIEFAVLIINVTISAILGVIGGTLGTSIQIYMASVIAVAIISQISALITASASRHLVQKTSTPTNEELSEQQVVRRIKIVANEITPPQNNIKENNDINHTQSKEFSSDQNNNIIEDLGWVTESDYTDNEYKQNNPYVWVQQDFKDSANYESITALIKSESNANRKIILMAAENISELPVTVPVNTAMRLAKEGSKCLLIDLDMERNAISKVFDIRENIQIKVIATCVKNISIYPASQSNNPDNIINIKDTIKKLESQYDYLIIYAPSINLPIAWDKTVGCIDTAMLFGPDRKMVSSLIYNFNALLTSLGCEILTPAEIFADVV
jgi:Mrp family chromosome partitioning ATPase